MLHTGLPIVTVVTVAVLAAAQPGVARAAEPSPGQLAWAAPAVRLDQLPAGTDRLSRLLTGVLGQANRHTLTTWWARWMNRLPTLPAGGVGGFGGVAVAALGVPGVVPPAPAGVDGRRDGVQPGS